MTALPTVLVTEHLSDEACAWLRERSELLRVAPDAPDFGDGLAAAEGLVIRTYTQVDATLLERAPRLRVVGRAGVGLDNVDLDACRARGVRVVYTPEANAQAVVEFVFSICLGALRPRRPLEAGDSVEAFHRRRSADVGSEFASKRVGVVGVGRVGRRVARVARAFGAEVLLCDLLDAAALGLAEDPPGRFVSFAELVESVDLLSLHVDGRPTNRHLVDGAVLANLRPTAWLLNTSRGMVVDPQALADWALRSEAQGGRAFLDVHDPEPPPAGHPTWRAPNIEHSAHVASRTDRALAAMSWVVRDVDRVLRGKAPQFEAPAP